ncbi:hypothetical protein TNCT_311121 [Trichonephila clavata]|uniref:Uncharacterized protein n=1 Tax=Trichonephila clavata TaxID=2740835 RepID=A0A8X6H0Y9_TRICU|nr:hypothetical protein TNCT_311121 [Trichonephila clavata]
MFFPIGAVASSKTYLESISKLARHAHQATWGGSTDIGARQKARLHRSREENSPRQSQNSSLWARLAVPKRLGFFPRIISLEETEMLGARTSGPEGF